MFEIVHLFREHFFATGKAAFSFSFNYFITFCYGTKDNNIDQSVELING